MTNDQGPKTHGVFFLGLRSFVLRLSSFVILQNPPLLAIIVIDRCDPSPVARHPSSIRQSKRFVSARLSVQLRWVAPVESQWPSPKSGLVVCLSCHRVAPVRTGKTKRPAVTLARDASRDILISTVPQCLRTGRPTDGRALAAFSRSIFLAPVCPALTHHQGQEGKATDYPRLSQVRDACQPSLKLSVPGLTDMRVVES